MGQAPKLAILQQRPETHVQKKRKRNSSTHHAERRRDPPGLAPLRTSRPSAAACLPVSPSSRDHPSTTGPARSRRSFPGRRDPGWSSLSSSAGLTRRRFSATAAGASSSNRMGWGGGAAGSGPALVFDLVTAAAAAARRTQQPTVTLAALSSRHHPLLRSERAAFPVRDAEREALGESFIGFLACYLPAHTSEI